jgi:5-methylthioadenosine/S-adenosylhomocysteine deaminase
MDPSSPLPGLSTLVFRSSALVRAGLSPHAPHTVSEKALREIGKFSLQKKIRLAMHVAESGDEVRFLQGKKSGFETLYEKAGWDRAWVRPTDSPFCYLRELGILGHRFLAVHAVQASDRDIEILKRAGVPVAHCPRSNKETAVGRMRLTDFLKAGITVGLGTDSLASSPSLNMWDEMRYAFKIHKRYGVSARQIFKIATIGGAKALGMDDEIGSLEPGKRADIIAVPVPAKLTGDIYSDLLRETNSCIMTMVNGKILWNGKR